MSQLHLVKIKSTESNDVIWTKRNKKQVPNKLALKKFDKTLKKHVLYKEMKK